MSLIKYEILNTVVETKSLTRAAGMLGLTQSAVSHAIASLESEWGFSLLTRDRNGTSLTANGARVLLYIREMLQWNEQLKQEVAAINGLEIGTVRIGTFTSVSAQWLPHIIKQFHTEHPSIEIKLFEGDYDEINQWVINGTADFGFVTLAATSKSLEFVPLKKDKMLCIVPDDHPFAMQSVISVAQIEKEAFIMPQWGNNNDVARMLKHKRITPNVKYRIVEDQAIIAMVQSRLGISIIPEMALFHLPDNIRLVDLDGEHVRTIGIAASSIKHMSPAAKTFMRSVTSWLRDNQLLDFS